MDGITYPSPEAGLSNIFYDKNLPPPPPPQLEKTYYIFFIILLFLQFSFPTDVSIF